MNSDISRIIRKRRSVRTFQKKSLIERDSNQLTEFIDNLEPPPFDSDIRFEQVAATGSEGDAGRKVGTYGFIKNAPSYIVGAMKPSDRNLEDFGYLMEHIVLHATGLGMGTCWLGLSFSKNSFSERANKQPDEVIPAVVAIGYTAGNQVAVEKIIRWGAGSNNRKPWEELFFNGNFDTALTGYDAGPLETPLEMVRIAPSASNKQPWRILVQEPGGAIHFFLQRTRNYKKNIERFKGEDLQRIDMGIAMCHFELAAREAGLSGAWTLSAPDGLKPPVDAEYTVTWKQG